MHFLVYVLLFVASQTLTNLGLALKGTRTMRLGFYLAIAAINTYMLLSAAPMGGLVAYIIGSTFAGNIFSLSYLYLLSYPLLDYRKNGQLEPATSLSFKERYNWIGDLLGALRGVGWTHQVANVPAFVAPRERSAFLRLTAFYFIRGVICQICILSTPRIFGMHSDVLTRESSVTFILFRRCVLTAFGGLNGHFTLCNAYRFATLLAVGFGESLPESWPEFFGDFGDSSTVRRFWGRSWHQNLRKQVTMWGDFLAQDVLHLPRGSNLSSYTKLYLAFAISAAIHMGGDYMLFQGGSWFSFRFFMIQAVGITLEDAVIALDKHIGVSARWPTFARRLGYLWVFSFFVLCAPEWFGPPLMTSVLFAS